MSVYKVTSWIFLSLCHSFSGVKLAGLFRYTPSTY